ncbi:glycosyltransferase [Muricauda sp. HICW]|uniref:Glycosyltransferase n=1 Tax=Flagellimonas chongwuensis TaxID=2697365 RepID=A0A850NJG5_9FLAO|nr:MULTISPECIES: glycosyltransferase family 4 protein [Allomuricauda]NVN19316.1 glycosyltransferase [Allomuricauda chongwuensis]
MKLLYITNQISGPGGLERVLSIKASYFTDELEHDVHILTLNDTTDSLFFDFSSAIQTHNIELKNSPIHYIKGYLKGIKNTISKVDPDIILVCDDGLKGMLLPLLIRKSRPMIYERHVSKEVAKGIGPNNLFNRLKTRLIYLLMRLGGQKFDAFVVLTQQNLKEWNFPNNIVIPNPLPFCKGEVSTLNNKIVIAVGKQSFQKGYDRLVKSWKDVEEKFPEWKLHIYGSEDPSKKIEKDIEKLNLSDSIKLFKPVKNIKEKFIESSVHVLSSRYEGFGMVIIEAMACGVPSVSFDCPYGPSDIIEDGKNGFLIPNGDIKALGQSLIDIIGNSEKRKKMGVYAFKSVDKFQMSVIGEKWNDLFEQLQKN